MRRLLIPLLLCLALPAAAQNLFAPVARVGDRVVTGYELDQRVRFNRALSAPGDLQAISLQQLVEDRLRLIAADLAGIDPTEEEVAEGMAEFAARANLSLRGVPGGHRPGGGGPRDVRGVRPRGPGLPPGGAGAVRPAGERYRRRRGQGPRPHRAARGAGGRARGDHPARRHARARGRVGPHRRGAPVDPRLRRLRRRRAPGLLRGHARHRRAARPACRSTGCRARSGTSSSASPPARSRARSRSPTRWWCSSCAR